MENINSTNKGKDLLLSNKLRIVWHRKITLHRLTHPKWEQNQTEKSSYGLDWLQNGIWCGSALLDSKLPQNVKNIRQSNKLHRKNYDNLESEIDNRGKED